MSFFRSEEMGLYKLVFEYSNCWKVLEVIGNLSALDIIRVNSTINSKESQLILQRCNNCEKIISYIEQLAKQFEINLPHPLDYSQLESELQSYNQTVYQSSSIDFNLVFESVEQKMWNKTYETLQRDTDTLLRLGDDNEAILLKCKAFEISKRLFDRVAVKPLSAIEKIAMTRIITVLNRDTVLTLQKLILRALKGNVLMKVEKINEPIRKMEQKKHYKIAMLLMMKEGTS